MNAILPFPFCTERAERYRLRFWRRCGFQVGCGCGCTPTAPRTFARLVCGHAQPTNVVLPDYAFLDAVVARRTISYALPDAHATPNHQRRRAAGNPVAGFCKTFVWTWLADALVSLLVVRHAFDFAYWTFRCVCCTHCCRCHLRVPFVLWLLDTYLPLGYLLCVCFHPSPARTPACISRYMRTAGRSRARNTPVLPHIVVAFGRFHAFW